MGFSFKPKSYQRQDSIRVCHLCLYPGSVSCLDHVSSWLCLGMLVKECPFIQPIYPPLKVKAEISCPKLVITLDFRNSSLLGKTIFQMRALFHVGVAAPWGPSSHSQRTTLFSQGMRISLDHLAEPDNDEGDHTLTRLLSYAYLLPLAQFFPYLNLKVVSLPHQWPGFTGALYPFPITWPHSLYIFVLRHYSIL